MRVLITGSEGQLGQALQTTLQKHTLFLADLPEVDVTDYQQIHELIADNQIELVIHCAALTDVDGCARDPELAYQVNGLGSQNVALACQAQGAALAHISTNEVFAGDRLTGYEEWMPLSPINPYGRSKAAAEFHVRHLIPQHYIIRTAWLYAPGGRNFIHAILDRARTKEQLQVVVDEVGNPTFVFDLAGAISRLIVTRRYGTYHFVNQGACSRWEFANEILVQAGLSEVDNQPILSRFFRRASTPPPYGALHNIQGAALGITLRPWREALAAYMEAHVL